MIRSFSLAASLGILGLGACDRSRSPVSKEYPPELTAFATEGGQGLPYLVGKDLRPVWKLEGSPPPREMGAFEFVDQSGRKMRSERLKGKVVVASFFFTHCPGICPMTTHNLKSIQEKFRGNDKVEIVSFSIDPQHDSPQALARYAREHRIDSRQWTLLTGDRNKIYGLARESFGADTRTPGEDEVKKLTADDFLHSENVYLIDGDSKVRGVYMGQLASSIHELSRDIQVLAR